MKRKAIIIVLATIVVAMAALLLEGCHERNKKRFTQKEPRVYIPAPIDTSKMDEEFYRRMREFEALHPDVPLDR
jgi:hypothetical protein